MKKTVGLILVTILLAAIPLTADAGAKGGPRRWTRKMKKNTELVYKVVFVGGQPAEFAFIGDGSNDLDLYITDSNGGKVAGGFDAKGQPATDGRDYFPSDIGLVRWIPSRTDTFTIRIKAYTAGDNVITFGHN